MAMARAFSGVTRAGLPGRASVTAAPARGIKVYTRRRSAEAVQEALSTFEAKRGVKDINKRRRESRYFIKPTKQRQANESNKTFYQGVREVEAVMGRVLEDHKNMGFG